MLLNYGWNGNVRELENLMEMLVVLNESGLITAKDIPRKYFKDDADTGAIPDAMIEKPAKKDAANDFEFSDKDFRIDLKKEMEKKEIDIINSAMEASGGVKEKAAKMLGLNRTTLIEKLKRYEKNKKK